MPSEADADVRVESYIAGTITSMNGEIVTVTNDSRITELRLVGDSRVWRGSWTTKDALMIGDHVHAWAPERISADQRVIDRVWANIVNLRGPALFVAGVGSRVSFSLTDPQAGEMAVDLDDETIIHTQRSPDGRRVAERSFRPSEGRVVQIIGLRGSDGRVRVTRLWA